MTPTTTVLTQLRTGLATIEAGLRSGVGVDEGFNGLVAAAAPPAPFQLVNPAQIIDVSAVITGSLPADVVAFCDAMAQDDTSETYAPGPNLSQAYVDALGLVAPSSAAWSLVQKAISVATPPRDDPATSPSPPGWTKVTDAAGIVRWAPLYSLIPALAERPAGGASSVSATVTSGTPSAGGLPARDALQKLAGATGVVTIDATWQRIAVVPGSWFDGAMLRLLRGATFVPPYISESASKPNAAAIFGPGGLLTARISALLVASNPTLTVAASPSVVQEISVAAACAGATVATVPTEGAVVSTQQGSVSFMHHGRIVITGVTLSAM